MGSVFAQKLINNKMIKTIPTILLVFVLLGCITKEENINLVPREAGTASNYWCTWYWQNYLILKGQEVTNPDAGTVYTNPAAREQMKEIQAEQST